MNLILLLRTYLPFQIYDYAQYYLDLAEANRKIDKTDPNDPHMDPAGGVPMTPNEAPDQALLAASSLTSAGAMGSHLHHRPSGPPQYGLWRVEYNFTSLYEINDINAATMESITSKLASNQTWFDAYFRTNMVNYEAPWACDEMCRAAQTCAINYVDYSQYAYCVEKAAAAFGGRERGQDYTGVNDGLTFKVNNYFLVMILFVSMIYYL